MKISGRDELTQLVKNISLDGEDDNIDITDAARETYTAVPLLCSPPDALDDGSAGGSPECFYSVSGALGVALEVRDGKLCWRVNSITGGAFNKWVSAFHASVDCRVLECIFDRSGRLSECADTCESYVHFA